MTSKLTASPEVLQLCTDLIHTGGIYLTDEQYKIVIMLAALVGALSVFYFKGLLKFADYLFDKSKQKSSEAKS